MGYKEGEDLLPAIISRPPQPLNTTEHKDSEEMANKFASVEWLSQSSLKEKKSFSLRSSPETPRDGETSAYSWSPVMRPFSKVAHVAPYPGTQRLTLSPILWDSDLSNHSSDYDISSCNLESPRLSPVLPCTDLPQRDLEASQNPLYNGLYTKSEKIFINNVQKPTSSQDIPTFSYETEKREEQKDFSEDLSHSGCTSSADSGYESETSRSDSATPGADTTEESSDASDEEDKMGRRLRTAFTTEQISTLESTFQKHKYLGASERRKLAAKLQLSEVQIKTWFQNRRMKHKREMQEGRQGQFHAAHIYGVYGYPPQPMQTYPYAHPMQQHYAPNPLLDPMSVNYASPASTMEPLNIFSHPQMPMMYLPHQSVMPPSYQYEEQQYVRY